MKNCWRMCLVVLVTLVASACGTATDVKPVPATPTRVERQPTPVSASLERERREVWHLPSGQDQRKVESPTTAGDGDRVWTEEFGQALLKWPDLHVRLYREGRMRVEDVTPTWIVIALDAGTALHVGTPQLHQRFVWNTDYSKITLTGTTIQVTYDPESELTLVRVFDGQAEVQNLTGDPRTESVVNNEWALIAPDEPPEVSDDVEQLRELARELDLWDLFHEVELDVQASFGPEPIPSDEVEIVFVEPTPTPEPAEVTPTSAPEATEVTPTSVPEDTEVTPTSAPEATEVQPTPDVIGPEVDVSHSPVAPDSTDEVAFTAMARDEGGLGSIEILVNDQLVRICLASPCSYVGGPYASGTVYYQARAYDNAENGAETEVKELTIPPPAGGFPSIQGTVRHLGQPLSQYTDLEPNFWMRDEDHGEVFPFEYSYDTSTGEYVIFDVPEGRYGIQVSLDVDSNGWPFPGDFYSWGVVTTPGGQETLSHDIDLLTVIHLLAPADTASELPWTPPYPVHAPGELFTWEAVPEAIFYRVEVDEYVSPPDYAFVRSVVSTQTSNNSFFADLPSVSKDHHYQFTLHAYGIAGKRIGTLMINYSTGMGWDYRFRIEVGN